MPVAAKSIRLLNADESNGVDLTSSPDLKQILVIRLYWTSGGGRKWQDEDWGGQLVYVVSALWRGSVEGKGLVMHGELLMKKGGFRSFETPF